MYNPVNILVQYVLLTLFYMYVAKCRSLAFLEWYVCMYYEDSTTPSEKANALTHWFRVFRNGLVSRPCKASGSARSLIQY